MNWDLRNEWGEPVGNADPFGNATGWTDGAGAVDMGDGTHAVTQDYETVRLPDELGGEWVCIISSSLRTLLDGRIGRHHVLAHPKIDCISLLNGDGALWVRKITASFCKPVECEHLNYSDTMDGAVCNDCGAEEGGEEE